LSRFQGERYWLDAFVVMPNHVHVLVQPKPGHSLSSILHSWKSFSAHAIKESFKHQANVWMQESHDRIVRDRSALENYRAYIASNPEKANLREGEFILSTDHLLQDADGESRKPGASPVVAGKPPGCQDAHQAGRLSAITAELAVFRSALLRAKKLGFSDR